MRNSTLSIADSVALVAIVVGLVILQSSTLFLANYLFGYYGAYIMGVLHFCAIKQLLHVLNKVMASRD